MLDYYKRFVFNPDKFRDMPVMSIIELLKKINHKKWQYLKSKGEDLNNQEMDFWVYFDNLFYEYNYMLEELNWDMNRTKSRLEVIKKMIFAGERFKPIWVKETNRRSERNAKKNKSLVQEFLEDWQDKREAILPGNPDYFQD